MEVGEVVCGYRVIRKIASGGQGDAYEAVHAATGELVCLKQAHSGLDQIGENTLRREADHLLNFDHPGLPAFRAFFCTPQGDEVLAMTFAEGLTLDKHVQLYGPLAPIEVLRVLAQLLDALRYLHDRGLVHRDVKPQNILIVHRSLQTTLVDFGCCTDDPEREHTRGFMAGTLRFMAPELAYGASLAAGDIYALAVTMGLAAGMVFHQGVRSSASASEILISAMKRFPLELSETPVEPRIVEVVAALGHHDPEARPTAAEAAALVADVMMEFGGAMIVE